MTLSAARVLTVRQPFASLIALGVKTIEARTWSTDYRGPLIIQAGARSFGGVNSTTAEMIRSWGLATCQRLRTGLGCDPEDCYGYTGLDLTRTAQLKALGNAQQPQVAYQAWRLLTGRLESEAVAA